MSEATTNMTCAEFEELLSDYLEERLGKAERAACATHVIGCGSCHELLNQVRTAVDACRSMGSPTASMTPLEARILESTASDALLGCSRFEEHLTDYLDGFLEASVFHRWERHAAVCGECSDLPGAVVRSLAACASVRWDQVEFPVGLEARLFGIARQETAVASTRTRAFGTGLRGTLRLTRRLQLPRLASVAAVVLFAFIFLVDGVSGDGSVSGVYAKGFELAARTYQQGADVVIGSDLVNPGSDGSMAPNPEGEKR